VKKIIQHLNVFQKEVFLIFLSTFLFATSLGINVVAFPTILSEHGVSSAKIGIAATTDILAGILIAFFLSKIAAKFGLMRTLFFSSSLYAIATALIYFYQNFYLWLTFCFIMGSTWIAFVVTRQSWLNSLLHSKHRGIGLGIFSLSISAGIAFGPVIVSFLGANNYSSFLASAFLTLLSFQVISRIKTDVEAHIESDRLNLKEFFKNNPRCFLAKFFSDFQGYFLIIFTVIFGKKIGLTPEKSGLLLSAYMLSGFFDVYVGFLLKKYDPYKLINIGFLGCLTLMSIISIYHSSYPFLLISYFVFGLFVALIFVSSFTVVNEDYPKKKLVAANASFQLIGSTGALCSGLIGGYFINIFGSYGFTITIIFGCISYLSFVIYHDKKLQNHSKE
jgi:MFS family permease